MTPSFFGSEKKKRDKIRRFHLELNDSRPKYDEICQILTESSGYGFRQIQEQILWILSEYEENLRIRITSEYDGVKGNKCNAQKLQYVAW